MNQQLPDVQAGFRKGRETRDQIANIYWITEKAREFQKNIYFHFIEYAKVFVWITTNCKIFLKRWEYQTTFPASREICVQVKKQQWEVDVEQWTGSKLGKEYTKATYCHLAYLTYMHSPSHPIEVFIANVVSSNISLSCVISVTTILQSFTVLLIMNPFLSVVWNHQIPLLLSDPMFGLW